MKGGDPETVLEVQTKDLIQETVSGPELIVPRTKVLETEQARALGRSGRVVKIKSALKLVIKKFLKIQNWSLLLGILDILIVLNMRGLIVEQALDGIHEALITGHGSEVDRIVQSPLNP